MTLSTGPTDSARSRETHSFVPPTSHGFFCVQKTPFGRLATKLRWWPGCS